MMGMLVRPLGVQDAVAAGVCGVCMGMLLWQGKAMDIATLMTTRPPRWAYRSIG